MGAFWQPCTDWKISKGRSLQLGEFVQAGVYQFDFTSNGAGFTGESPLTALFIGVGIGVSAGIFSASAQGRAFGLKGSALEAANRQRSQLSHAAERLGRRIEQRTGDASRFSDATSALTPGGGTRLTCHQAFSARDLNMAQGGFGKIEAGVGASVSGDGVCAFQLNRWFFATGSFDSGVSFTTGVTGMIGIWKVITDPLPEYGNLWFARGYVQSLFMDVRQSASLMEERDRNRYIAGINAADRMRSVIDHEGRDLRTHIIHNYFRHDADIQRQLRQRGSRGGANTIHIDREELARRIARFLDNNPGLAVEMGYD